MKLREREKMATRKGKAKSIYGYQLFSKDEDKFIVGIDMNPWAYSRVRFKVRTTENAATGTITSMDSIARIYGKKFELEALRDEFKSNLRDNMHLSDSDFEMMFDWSRQRYAEDLETISKTLKILHRTELRRVVMQTVEDDDGFSAEKKAHIKKLVSNTFLTQVEKLFEDAIQVAKFYSTKSKTLHKQGGVFVRIADEDNYTVVNRYIVENITKKSGIDVIYLDKPYGFVGILYIKDESDLQMLRLALPAELSVVNTITVEELKKRHSNVKKNITQQLQQAWDM
jgi:hypothetical protein